MGLVPAAVKRRDTIATCTPPARSLSFEWTGTDLSPALDIRFGIVSEARAAVRSVALGLWRLSTDAADDIVQIFSELLANALQHGEPPIGVSLDQGFTGAITISVADMGDALPELCTDVPEHAERLRGLVVVDALAQAWDVQLRAKGGKTVSAVVVPAPPRRVHRSARRKPAAATLPLTPRSARA